MPGMTFKSVSISIFGLVVMAVLVQFFGVFAAGSAAPFGTEAIPLDALMTFALLVLLGGCVYAASRYRILNPPEMLCVMYVLLLAAPVMTTGFWRSILASSATIVKEEDWEHYDSMSPSLWPHGADLMGTRLQNPHAAGLTTTGNVHWETLAVAPGQEHPMPVLEDSATVPTSSLFYRFPVMENGVVKLPLNEPYMLTMRARGEDLGPQSRYYVRLIYDDHTAYDTELFSSFDGKNVTYFQPEGFNRHGLYGFPLPSKIKDHLTVEVGLTGPGRLEVSDLNFFNLSALQGAYTGHRLVTREIFDHMPPAERTTVVVMPKTLLSFEGIRFILDGYIFWREWSGPLFLWGGYVTLLLGATFAFASLIRRQWVENERLPLPMTQVPITLAGLEGQLREGVSYLRNHYLWGGFVLMFIYSACNALRFYFTSLPDLSVNIPLKSYLPDPTWGATWDTSFTFSGLTFALALFMDLNVLFSLFVGFFLFRFQFWFGEAQGLTVDDAYPYTSEQNTGGLLSYGLIILFVARRFLFGTVREAWRGGVSDEVISPRAAYLLLFGVFIGVALLCHYTGIGVAGPLVLTVCVLLCLLVAMKLRAESGYTSAAFLTTGAQSLTFLFALFGSLSFFSAQTAIFWGLFTSMFIAGCFPLIPGLQVELVALGHRMKLSRKDILFATVLGIGGGMVIGGWVYLTGAYAVGASNFPIVGNYMSLGGLVFLTDAISKGALPGGAGSYWDSWWDPHHLAFVFGASVTIILSLLRQMYAGFWFHPFGFILGTSAMMQGAWGSILAAWVVRLGVLRLGGAVSVRERLFPFAVGCVLAIVGVSFLVAMVHGYAYFFNPGGPKPPDQY